MGQDIKTNNQESDGGSNDGRSIIVLPAELTIYEAEECHQDWLKVLTSHNVSAIFVDANQVVELDGAGFQLLFWLKLNCEQRAITFSIAMADELTSILSRLQLLVYLTSPGAEQEVGRDGVGH